MTASSMLWRRVDVPGHEAAHLRALGGGWELAGCAAFAHASTACQLTYRIACDASWRTVSASVEGWVGSEPVRVQVEADERGRWRMNGSEIPAVGGCIDVDLNFSPSTNLLPIRRLALPIDRQATVRAAWLRFPSFRLEPLEQTYRRTAEQTYRYESAGGTFVRDLHVNGHGFVTEYPGFWVAEELA